MADKDPSNVAEVRGESDARDAATEPHTPRHPHPASKRSTRMLKGPENAAHCAAWCSADCRTSGCRVAAGEEKP